MLVRFQNLFLSLFQSTKTARGDPLFNEVAKRQAATELKRCSGKDVFQRILEDS